MLTDIIEDFAQQMKILTGELIAKFTETLDFEGLEAALNKECARLNAPIAAGDTSGFVVGGNVFIAAENPCRQARNALQRVPTHHCYPKQRTPCGNQQSIFYKSQTVREAAKARTKRNRCAFGYGDNRVYRAGKPRSAVGRPANVAFMPFISGGMYGAKRTRD